MPKQPRTQNYINPASGMSENIITSDAKHPLKQRDNHQPANDDVKRRDAMMRESFIDDDLCQNRRENANNLHYQRRQQDLQQWLFIFDDRRNEPFEIEFPVRFFPKTLRK